MKSNSLNSNLPNDWVLIVENVGEDLAVKSRSQNNTILEGVCAVFGEMNNNRRVYEKNEYLPHLSYLKEKISKGQLVGDLDHPPHFDVTLKSASHIIEDLYFDGDNKVMIKLRILENTPNGKIAKALLDGGVTLSVSSRSAGEVLSEGRVRLHRIFTYDLVGEPGFTQAVLKKTMNESLKSEFEMITESYDAMKNRSFVETHNLDDVSESLNFADNYKVYKINKKDKEFKSVFETSISQEKNTSQMADFVTKDQMNQYSEVLKQQIQGIKKELKEQKSLLESSNSDVDSSKLTGFVNYLAENMEGLINYTEYLSKKMNEAIRYTEHVAETTNNSIEYTSYIGEKLNQSINYQEYVAEKVDQNIKYSEYLKENLNTSINYQNYLGKELDESIQYIEYVAEGANKGLEYSEYLAENLNLNRDYSDYISNKLTESIGYTEYVVESLNSGSFTPAEGRNLLNGVSKVDQLISKVDEALIQVKNKSAKEVLENKHPFLKVLSESNRSAFYNLDSQTKQAVVETLNGSVWFNENEVMSIMEAVVNKQAADLPNYLRFMPAEYKSVWTTMNESEQNRIHAKAQLFTINTPYQAKAFWDEMDFRAVNERVEIEKHNLKIAKLNESQGTEGLIPVEQVVDMQRGYSQSYLDGLLRRANS